jgi:hypothetical protein
VYCIWVDNAEKHAGLAVECALKSCLAGAVKEHDFPDKKFVNAMYVHNLEKLFKLIKDWDDSKRYDIVEELQAKALHEATGPLALA